MNHPRSAVVRRLIRVAILSSLLVVGGAAACGDEDDDEEEADTADAVADADVAPGDVADTGPDTVPDDDTGPVDTGIVDTTPADTEPADTAPADTEPADTAADTGRDIADIVDVTEDVTADPPELAFARMVGTAGEDQVFATASHELGNTYVVGRTSEAFGNQSYNGGEFDGFVAKYNASGERVFVRMLGSEGRDEARAVAVNSQGDVYVAGVATQGVGDRSYNGGESDAFVAKYEGDGTREFVRMLGGEGRDEAQDIAANGNNDFYVVGATDGNLGGQTGDEGSVDGFLAKYDPAGARQYIRLQETTANEQTLGVAAADTEAVYVAGFTGGSLADQSPAGQTDAFLARYTPDGDREFAQLFGSDHRDDAQDVIVDGRGNIYVAGAAGAALDDQTYAGGDSDAFIARFETDGSTRWIRLLGGSGEDFALSMAPGDQRRRPVFVAGATSGPLAGQDYGGGPRDGFVASYGPAGALRWVRLVGGSGEDLATSVSTPQDSAIYTGGTASSGIAGETFLGGGLDGFLLKWNQ